MRKCLCLVMRTKNKYNTVDISKLSLKFTKQRNQLKVNHFIDEYKPDNTIWSEESEILKKIKFIIFHLLTEQERNILLYYSETQKQKEVAKALGISLASTHKQISTIREKIKYYLNKKEIA